MPRATRKTAADLTVKPTDMIEAALGSLAFGAPAGTTLIPIHAVRALAGLSRGDFDAAFRTLRAAGRVRAIAISDLRKATREQIADSIPGELETLFYFVVA